ncbi:argininosuccinate lyase [Candidatus Marinamargulisbacteria bacterium SCGC AG-439-L15]|nr:argininosuccinate lyase [Candidatus Marinamargulisbacteria bacterium SCGC AG-439-L15]
MIYYKLITSNRLKGEELRDKRLRNNNLIPRWRKKMSLTKEKVNQEVGKQQLWASRFKKQTDPRSKQYTDSTIIDKPMFYHNIWGSEAHTIMLGKTGVITDSHTKEILTALQKIKDDFANGDWDLRLQEEDVQMNVERYVIDTVGIENGGRMHTCRSRNDQVVVDTKLYAREYLRKTMEKLIALIETFLTQAKDHTHTLMPGYTHTQHAQPMTYAYWLTHYAAVFLRDLERLLQADSVNNTNPLGAGALTGTSFPIDRELTTKLLGFEKTQDHCLDAVGAKDFNLQILSGLSILMSSVSRLADEIIYGITQEFNTMVLDDSFSMGSSMMPQKKNPGVLELVRGRTGKMYGILMAMLTTMKGLPSGYNRDYHEDKETLVEALNLAHDSIDVMQGVMETLTIKEDRLKELASENFATATELANYLVREHDIPFRLCHRIVGYVVGELVQEGKNFNDKARTKELLAEKEIQISDEDYEKTLNPEKVIQEYKSQGGTEATEVTRLITNMTKELTEFKTDLESRNQTVESAKAQTQAAVSAILNGSSAEEAVAKGA